mgnify:FL=1
MKRKITNKLIEWKNNPERKPLIINGARQVGKTYIIERFGEEHYDSILYLNMEIESSLNKFFETEISPPKIIQYLEATRMQEIVPGKTLIFIDEIQTCERAITSLKYFCEQMPEHHIIGAGSLLGVAINREKFSFPVGKVNEISMYPMDFEEFLWAMNGELIAEKIKEHFTANQAMPEAYHDVALDWYQKYFIIGGMPAAVSQFVKTESFIKCQNIQNEILNQYLIDMSKYADPTTGIKIRACYNSIPAQLAKENAKFQYKVVQRGGTATIFGEAIDWLIFAGISLKCQRLDHGFLPISAYVDLINFKLYMADIGLLTLHSKIPLQTILSPIEIDNTFLGAMTENYIAQVLTCSRHPLMYWESDGKAEVDFVLQIENDVIPVEVKKGKRNRSKSLHLFIEKYESPYAIRISKKNFGFENRIKSVPLYAAICI